MSEATLEAPVGPASTGVRPPLSARLVRRSDVWLFALLIVVVVISIATVPNFGTTLTLGFLLVQVVPILLVAMPMALIIVTGEIDLSVASIAGLTSAVMGVLWRDTGWNIWLVIAACLVVGVICGVVNGVLIAVVGLSSLAVTIGTLALFRGLALVVIGDQKVSDFPTYLTTFATKRIGDTGIPVVMIGVVVLIAIFAVVLHLTSFGRTLFALGHSPEAARFVGIRVNRAKFWLFVVSGLISALMGVFWTLRFASAGPDNATGVELQVIAAVLLGGVSIFGGRGTIAGVVVGVLLIGTLTYALRLAQFSETTLSIVTGLLLVLSVTLPQAFAWAREKRRTSRLRSHASVAPPAG